MMKLHGDVRDPLLGSLKRRAATALGIAVSMGLPQQAAAEWMFSAYGGSAWHLDSDVDFDAPNGDRLNFEDVAYRTEPFTSPPYWGLRAGRWFSDESPWGVAIDFVHSKVIAERGDNVTVTGTRGGAAVNTVEPLSNTFSTFEYTDGMNLATLTLFRRWQETPWFVKPYAGIGGGAAVPYVEVTGGGADTREYQLVGGTVHGIAGIELPVRDWVALFGEYRGSYVMIDADVDGGTVEHDMFSNHVGFGLNFKF